jgi:hypothetical protein
VVLLLLLPAAAVWEMPFVWSIILLVQPSSVTAHSPSKYRRCLGIIALVKPPHDTGPAGSLWEYILSPPSQPGGFFLALNRFGWPTGQRSQSGGFENVPDFICGYGHDIAGGKNCSNYCDKALRDKQVSRVCK